MSTHSEYIPALGFDWLTPLYDPLLRYVMREETFRRRLGYEAALVPGQQVLDVGSGTGTLAIMLKQHYPDALVYGVDIDPKYFPLLLRRPPKHVYLFRYNGVERLAYPMLHIHLTSWYQASCCII